MPLRENEKTATFNDVVAIKETEKALLVKIEDDEHWIPKDQIHADSEVFDDETNNEGKLVISEWIAKKRNLV